MKEALRLTEEQCEIVSMTPKRSERIVVQAYAGTGKTSTLLEFARAKPKEKMLYLAYNRSMAQEAKEKFAPVRNVAAKTIHALAFSEIGKQYASNLGDITPFHMRGVMEKFGRGFDFPLAAEAASLLRSYFSSKHTSLEEYAESLDEETLNEKALELAKRAWRSSIDRHDGLPMPHNGYLKLFHQMEKGIPYSLVLVDEAQDITECVMEIILKQKAACIFIGDTYQQIYGWNGAVDSLAKLEKTGAAVRYLTQSFRCPNPVAEMANRYLRVAGATKPFHGNGEPPKRQRPSVPAFLARSNALIFLESFFAVSKGRRPYFLGGFDGYNFDIILDIANAKLGNWGKIRNRFILDYFTNYQEMLEYAKTDQLFLSRLNIAEQYGKKVFAMYEDIRQNAAGSVQSAGEIFSTAHKAKGAEWKSVTLGNDFLSLKSTLSKMGNSSKPVTVKKEELNLLYVASTRSKATLAVPKEIALSDKAAASLVAAETSGRLLLM